LLTGVEDQENICYTGSTSGSDLWPVIQQRRNSVIDAPSSQQPEHLHQDLRSFGLVHLFICLRRMSFSNSVDSSAKTLYRVHTPS
jgi:hypothetical protein